MPEALYIHRRLLSDNLSEDSIILEQIYYSFTDEGLVDIHKIMCHYVDDDGTVGSNIFGDEIELSYDMKLSLLSILVEDGVIEIP